MVEAEVLRAYTPIQVAQLAAGLHQQRQRDTKDINTYDIMAMLAMKAEKKKKDQGSPYLDDGQLFLALESMGMVSLAKLVQGKKESKKSPNDLLVCFKFYVTNTNYVHIFHREINSCRGTGPCASWCLWRWPTICMGLC